MSWVYYGVTERGEPVVDGQEITVGLLADFLDGGILRMLDSSRGEAR